MGNAGRERNRVGRLSLPLSLTNPQLAQLHEDSALMRATIFTALHAPQLDVLRNFYGHWFAGSPADFDPLVALSLAATLLILTARRME